MAKVSTGPGRKSTSRPIAEVEMTREEAIKHLAALGMSNEAMWGAMEGQSPSIIEDTARRHQVAGEDIPFDAQLRQRIGWQIRSVKGLAIKENEMMEGIVQLGGEVKSIADTEYTNRERWNCGMPSIDYLYGETLFKLPDDAPNSKYKNEKIEFVDKSGKKIQRHSKIWVSGDWHKGDPMCLDENGTIMPTRDESGMYIGEQVKKFQKIQHGLPSGYIGFWGGEPGVGKSRNAINLTHSMNSVGRLVHYYNGEADPSDFRSWCGANVNRDLFRVFHTNDGPDGAELVPLSLIERSAIEEQPSLIIIDSFQLIAEASKGSAGQRRVLARLKALKGNEKAGRPHIIIISQLNKKLELAGQKYLEHMVDYSIKVYRRQGYKNQFYMESMKMRGAECPRCRLFKHTDDGIVCLSEESSKPIYDLQQTDNPIIANGVQLAPIVPSGLTGESLEDFVNGV